MHAEDQVSQTQIRFTGEKARARQYRQSMVPPARLERALPKETDFESVASTGSATGAMALYVAEAHRAVNSLGAKTPVLYRASMTDAAAPHAPIQRTLLQSIEAMADESGVDGYSLRQIMDRLDERAFGAMLFILALPCCIPFLYLVPQIVALPMMALAAQMAMGREEPWLPAKLAERKINQDGLASTARGGRKWFGWVETIARPRLTFLTGKGPERVIGAILCVFCASILLPFPMTNTVPGFAVALASFGLIQRDGLLVIGGLLLGSAWVSFLVFAAIFGLETVTGLISGLISGN